MKNPRIPFQIPIDGNEAFWKIPTRITGNSLYFHIPFCQKKCPYCHFYSIPWKSELQEKFLLFVQKEWELRKNQIGPLVSLYFGGGTPSLLKEAIGKLIDLINPPSDCEITLEANPDSITRKDLFLFRNMGCNRLSLGIQSFDDALLRILKRNHSSQKALSTIDWAKDAGFENLSIDLMYDIPTQTLDSWRQTLHQLETLPLSHLSLYNLTFEPNTLFHRKKNSLLPLLPNAKLSLRLLQEAVKTFAKWGFVRYEISAFAKKGLFSRHNVGYWIGQPFFGFGPSAWSYSKGIRSQNTPSFENYCQNLSQGKPPIELEEKLSYPHNITELFAIELRLIQGVDLKIFEKKHGSLPPELFASIRQLEKEHLLQNESHLIRLTEKGILFYDSVATALM